MRVPGISATAGYAASTHYDAYLNKQIYTGLPSRTELNKNNGNYAINTQQLSSESTSNFASSADEFVKRALSSAPTTYETETNFEFLRRTNESKNFNKDIKQSPVEKISTGEEANQYNTYRSFKDAFNINKSFYEECAKNSDTLNSQDIEDDIDPILVINTPYSPKSAFKNMKISSSEEKSLSEKLETITAGTDDITSHSSHRRNIDNFDDNDYDDQTMLDLCQNRVNETLNDREAYLTSPTSSSISDHTPKRTFSYFPRGIINPNYPGFQHLAHTLSEHFITSTSQSDSFDSDMSEYEMELSADSFEDISDEANEQFNLQLNKFNNNLESQQSYKKMHPDELLETEPHVYDTYMTCADNSDDNCNVDIRNLPISLKTTLTLLEPADHIPTPCETPEPTDINEFVHESKPKYPTTPPDILMEDDHLNETQKIIKKENRPDLLHGVSPYHVAANKHKIQSPIQNTMLTVEHVHNVLEMPPKDEMSLGVTPVDIIGDFGQEVEREFGLLVSGYRRLMDGSMENNENDVETENTNISGHTEQFVDGSTSNADDNAADLTTKNENDLKEQKTTSHTMAKPINKSSISCDFIEDNNAVDWSIKTDICPTQEEDNIPIELDPTLNEVSSTYINENINIENESKSADNVITKRPIYQKASYDERQLPPVAIEYKRCQHNQRKGRSSQHTEKNGKPAKKASFTNRFLHGKRSVFKSTEQANASNRKREEAEIHQYQQLINDKELILSNSRYTKLSSWAQYLKNSVKDRSTQKSTELISPSALELFDAYKVGGEVDKETLQKHLKMAKEIEKKSKLVANFNGNRFWKYRHCGQSDGDCIDGMFPRVCKTTPCTSIELTLLDRHHIDPEYLIDIVEKFLRVTDSSIDEAKRYVRRSDREEIRRRLAMGGEENSNNITERQPTKSGIQSALHNGLYICRLNDISSDTESHSSDSETCPKLSKIRQQSNLGPIGSMTNDHTSNHPYHGRPLSVSCTNKLQKQQDKEKEKEKQLQQQRHNKELLPISDEDKECDFFTKQARLQIEARMALSQAKEMAHMHMEFERQNRRMSPITGIIRSSLDKIGVQMVMDKRRVSRQMLTDMNIAQLQILVNSLHTHIEDLNESLVQFLMERDDLHVGQDAMLADIEELTRFIGAQEHLTHQHKKTTKCNRYK